MKINSIIKWTDGYNLLVKYNLKLKSDPLITYKSFAYQESTLITDIFVFDE